MSEWFKHWFNSPYYHILYQHRDEEEARLLVQAISDRLPHDKGSQLLDLACGKGRHALEFARHGFRVTGADLSPASIEAALAFSTDNPEFVIHDMRKVFRINYFDVIVNLFTSFGYFRTAHDHHLAARAIALGLKPDGYFVFDFVNQSHALQQIQAQPDELKVLDGIEFRIQRLFESNQYIKRIQFEAEGRTWQFEERVNSLTYDWARELFESQGLHLQDAFGNYSLETYEPNSSPRMILLFKK
ncbi:MAG: class I SAM-dependent methyltransferase [Chitinophagaceae bacterium]|nr:class I SAM-dependent methyltransferase [Chitinophagaceae bacterium]